VDPANLGISPDIVVAIIANELRHRPRLEGRAMSPKPRKMPDQQPNQLTFVFPELRQQFALFFRR
jgi:hypothetical protein